MSNWQRIENPLGTFVGVAFVFFLVWCSWQSPGAPPAYNQSTERAEHSRAPITADKPEKDTDWAAWATVLLNCFLVAANVLLWRANNRSAGIAERALTGLERPRVVAIGPNFGTRDDKMTVQFGLFNYGRDPGRVIEIAIKFFKEQPPIPADFSDAEIKEQALLLLPISYFDQFTQARVGQLFEGGPDAKFVAVRIRYEWDFGKHEHAAAWTVALGAKAIIETVGGRDYNYDK